MLFVLEMRVPTGAPSSRQEPCCESLNEIIRHPTLFLYGYPLHHGRSVLTVLPQSGPEFQSIKLLLVEEPLLGLLAPSVNQVNNKQ